jgi:hypothetical protein
MNLGAAAMLIVGLAGSTAGAQPFDHLLCSRVKDPAPKAAYVASLTPSGPELPGAAGCIIKVPAKQLCVDVTKTDVSPPPPGAPSGAPAQRYLCYKTKCPRQDVQVPAMDQFGSRVVLVVKPGLVCAPVVTTTTTTSTTTTSTTLPASVRCCSLGPSCFDAAESFVTTTCPELAGAVGAPGTSCDGTTGACAAVGAPGQLCCDCPMANFCMEGPIVPLGDLCSQVGCTALVGYTCDVVTQHCRP